MDSYQLIPASAPRVPILLSVPHCGTAFPDEIKDEYVAELIESPDDTDWYVDQLYNFAPSLGITMITAVLSRWVIDLNRHPESKPLYTDGRIITDLCPVTTFLNQPFYRDGRMQVETSEIQRRTKLYFNPYHQKLADLLEDLKSEFGTVLLWDCHSIRQVVPTIQKQKFPDLILGSADGKSAHSLLIEKAWDALAKKGYTLEHNHPFKGGYITRHYAKPSEHKHVLQLEMTKVNYMDDSEICYHPQRAEKMGKLLNNALRVLASTLTVIKD
jgi:N-formylglutamate deformylase